MFIIIPQSVLHNMTYSYANTHGEHWADKAQFSR